MEHNDSINEFLPGAFHIPPSMRDKFVFTEYTTSKIPNSGIQEQPFASEVIPLTASGSGRGGGGAAAAAAACIETAVDEHTADLGSSLRNSSDMTASLTQQSRILQPPPYGANLLDTPYLPSAAPGASGGSRVSDAAGVVIGDKETSGGIWGQQSSTPLSHVRNGARLHQCVTPGAQSHPSRSSSQNQIALRYDNGKVEMRTAVAHASAVPMPVGNQLSHPSWNYYPNQQTYRSKQSSNGLYKKLSLDETLFPQDKHVRLSLTESWIQRYNKRLRPSGRILTLSLVLLSFTLGFILVHFCSSGFGVPVILNTVLIALASLIFSFWLLSWILNFDEGTTEMREVAIPIREGSEGFIQVQYGTIAKISLIFSIALFLLYWFRDSSASAVPPTSMSPQSVAIVSALTFLLGALCSALSGFSGMWVSVRTNVRVASAARCCYNEALQLCFRGGAFSSIINVALAVGGLSLCMLFLLTFWPRLTYTELPLLLVGFGFGASLVAMFAQLGGGIYTKAADVGADLVGKVEAGIPEDDRRNPAVIADLVGDNVGDCAGQCADLFESIAAEIISAMILGGALAQQASMPPMEAAGVFYFSLSSSFQGFCCDVGFVLFPLGVHSMDLIISSIGILLVRTRKGMPDGTRESGCSEDPLAVMIRSYLITCALGILGFGGLCRVFLYSETYSRGWMYFWGCGVLGMICAFLFVLITQYYTDYEYSKVRRIAEASVTGPATNIIAGLAVGLESTALPVILISVCVLLAYYLGQNTGILPVGSVMAGLFGTAVATMGMLCTAVFVLTMSAFGPIADNAGGIVEMSQQAEHVRAITDRLDAVGNVTKANTKGFSVGSAALACFLLFSAFMDEVSFYTGVPFDTVNLANPCVFIAGLTGAALVFLFCALAMEAVGRAAQQVVEEVRRQFAECPGIMNFTERPDYHTCVAIVSRSALKEMIRPGLLSILSPICVGLIFRYIGQIIGQPDLGAQAVAGFLMFSTATGILMALFLNNAGGAWDNAKKFIETGAFGGKNSNTHKAAVVGDTVGDPAKDTAGPSVHVLIKLVSTVTMVLAPIFVPPVIRAVKQG